MVKGYVTNSSRRGVIVRDEPSCALAGIRQKTSCCLVLFTRSGIASHAIHDVPRIHPFGSPAVVSRRDPTRSFAMPPLRTVCPYRG